MKEASNPKLDGFLCVEEIVEHLAGSYRLRWDDGTLRLVHEAGVVRSDTLERLLHEGWLEQFANCGGYRLSDEGRKAYLRSTDELGDGMRPPKTKAGGA